MPSLSGGGSGGGGGGGGAGAVLSAYKAADTDRTTSVMSDDPDLTIDLEAGKAYRVEVNSLFSGHATGDFKRGLNITGTGNTVAWMIPDRGTPTYIDDQFLVEGVATGGGPYLSTIVGMIPETVSAGTIAFSWAQNADFATPTTVHAGSNIVVTEMA